MSQITDNLKKPSLMIVFLLFAHLFFGQDIHYQLPAEYYLIKKPGLLETVAFIISLTVILIFVFYPKLISGGRWKDIKIFNPFTKVSFPKKNIAALILLSSALGLFIEFSIIRIHSSYLPIFSFFKNITLLSSFLGLGIGFLKEKSKPTSLFFVIPLFVIQIVFLKIVSHSPLAYNLLNPVPENVTMGISHVQGIGLFFFVYLFMLVIFIFNTLMFIPLGNLASYYMNKKNNLESYALNLLGSILGIIVFLLVSYLWTPPEVWLLISFAGIMYFVSKSRMTIILSSVFVAIAIFFMNYPQLVDRYNIYSPYQDLVVQNLPEQYVTISANKTFFQRMLDLSPEKIDNKYLSDWAKYYNFAYKAHPNPERVLIIGAGSGNDAAAAIRNNSKTIDAVEIDPAIIKLGQKLHPEDPYNANSVDVHTQDARNFIKYTENKYDLVVYGLLDSHTLVSNASSVRLDSFVYTKQAFEETKNKLKKGGTVVMTFAGQNPLIGKKLALTFSEVFKEKDTAAFYIRGTTLVATDNKKVLHELKEHNKNVLSELLSSPVEVDVATDDWPFLYMQKKTIPSSVIILLLIFFLASYILINNSGKDNLSKINIAAFLLGAGFMLVETKAITELSLYFGSTWLVVGIASVSVLVLALLANLYVQKTKKIEIKKMFLLLFLTLLGGVWLANTNLQIIDQTVLISTAVLLLTLPMLFSGIAFSYVLQRSKSVGSVLSSNLLGAMLGGFLEYSSMRYGYTFLYFIAGIIYLLAYFYMFNTNKKSV